MSSRLRDTADRLHSAAIHLLRHVRGVDAASGLTAARLSVLSVLVFGGDRRVTELAEAEQVQPPTMSRLIDGLERDGFVQRRSEPNDARAARVRATAKGRAVLEAARRRRIDALEALLRQLTSEDAATLAAASDIIERL